jgi:hypothetical protein
MCRACFVALALLGLLAPRTVQAQNGVTGVGIEVHATFENAGVTVAVSGDANLDASAALEVDVGGAGFHPGHRLSRVSATSFVGSAFFLPPATGFDVRVTLTDPDGVTNGTLTAHGTTRDPAVPTGTGATYHVTRTGSDAGDGSTAAPFLTIGRGLQEAQPGDTVLVHVGVYHEEIAVPRGGNPGAPITVRGAGDGPAVLDGADPVLKDPGAWTSEGGGLWRATVAETRYVAVDGVRLWRYTALADLQTLSLGTAGGFFHDGTAVHVRLPGDAAPTGHEIQVSTFGHALWLEGTPNVVIDGLTIRCYGAAEYSEGIMVRDGSHGVWIVNSVFENVMPGIWVKGVVDDLAVRGNEFSDRGLTEFPWYAVKDQGGMESGALSVDNEYDGQGIVFGGNLVHDTFDGLHICGDQSTTHPNNADVIGNSLRHGGDDGMETDGVCSNVRILRNRFEDFLCGVSVAPAVGGPTYVVRNLLVRLNNVSPDTDWMTRALKFNVGDDRPSGEIFAYHNTATTEEAGQAAFAVTDDSLWTAVHLLNNIWVGTDYAFDYTNAGDEPFDEDYDLLFSTGSRLVQFQGGRYDAVPAYFAATGRCEHCLAGDPLFAGAAGGDYALTAGSPAVDSAVAVPGVNDEFAGAGPDRGALELGGDIPIGADGDADWSAEADAVADADTRDTGGDARDAAGDGSIGGGDSGGCGCIVAGSPAPSSLLFLGFLSCLLLRRRSS